jgi:hypothetical protein
VQHREHRGEEGVVDDENALGLHHHQIDGVAEKTRGEKAVHEPGGDRLAEAPGRQDRQHQGAEQQQADVGVELAVRHDVQCRTARVQLRH